LARRRTASLGVWLSALTSSISARSGCIPARGVRSS
jgi:hypothetical protein